MDKEIERQLYDPGRKHTWRKVRAHWRRLYDTTPQSKRPPERWFYAMYRGIARRSDVSDPAGVVGGIWKRLSPAKRKEIRQRELAGEKFVYDLPLPKDCATRGTGTVRTVEPFDLAEVQVNVNRSCYDALKDSGLFDTMRRQDGSTALVRRCKSSGGNANIFVDRI